MRSRIYDRSVTKYMVSQIRYRINYISSHDNLISPQTHPVVAEALAEGDLYLQGLVYEIESGGFRIYCPKRRAFAPLAEVEVDELRPDPAS